MTSSAQNTSPVNVIEFNKIQNGIMDEGRLQKNQLEDYDNNPVCEIKVKAQGFDEVTLQKLIFVPKNIMIMHKAYENGEYRLYVSSKKPGSIVIKYQGDCEFKLPYNLEPKKIYELVLDMETATLVIRATPEESVIYIDDERVGTGNVSQAVSIGAEHRYRVECDNYFEKEDVVILQKGERKSLNIELEPAFGFITVRTTPSGADVYIDDKIVGKTPYLSEIISRGMHKITVNKEGYETAVKRLNINVNEESNVEFELVEGESSMPVQQVQQRVAAVASVKDNVKPKDGVFTDSDGNKIFTVCDVTFKMIKVEGGKFIMAEGEIESHEVTLSDYYIGEFEVTQELWKAVMGSNPSYNKGNKNPVEKVSWKDCQDFVSKLNQLTGAKFRLPTEAEWEYAARGADKGKGYKYSGSSNINDVAWNTHNSYETHSVGTKSSNELGIYDMSGNVLEWCSDWYGKYGSESQTNPKGASSGSCRVLRGGSFFHFAKYCRVLERSYSFPGLRDRYTGLRIAVSE